jgi:hypothetical protein
MISFSAIPRLSLTHTETGFGETTFVQKKKGRNPLFIRPELTLRKRGQSPFWLGEADGYAFRTSDVVEVYVGRSRFLSRKPFEDLSEAAELLAVLAVA